MQSSSCEDRSAWTTLTSGRASQKRERHKDGGDDRQLPDC